MFNVDHHIDGTNSTLVLLYLSLDDIVVHILALPAIDLRHIIRTRTHGNDTVHLCPEVDMISWFTSRRLPRYLSSLVNRYVHPHIERAWRKLEALFPNPLQRFLQIVIAIAVVLLHSILLPIPVRIARRYQRIVVPRTGIRFDSEDVGAAVCHESVADSRDDFAHRCTSVWHGHMLRQIVGVEGP